MRLRGMGKGIAYLGTVVFAAMVFLFATTQEREHYALVKDYARGMGVEWLSYKALTEKYGEPESEEVIDEGFRTVYVYRYPSFTMRCVRHYGADGVFIGDYMFELYIRDPAFRFGHRKIGVGSTQEEIQRAYKNDRLITDEYWSTSPPADVGFSGERGMRILFRYDESGRVSEMIYQPPVH